MLVPVSATVIHILGVISFPVAVIGVDMTGAVGRVVSNIVIWLETA